MNQLALVTGGAGFIGSHLVDALVARGTPVRVLDDISTGLLENLAHHGSRIEFIKGSITDATAVADAMRGADVVFHLGALASVARSLENPPVSHAACATGTLIVLDEARKAGVKRVVYAASSSAYGGASDPTGQKEDQPLCALSPYAAAKLAGEHYMQAFAACFSIETVRLRFFNIFGPRQRADSPYSGVIAIFTAIMSEDKPPTVHGDGLQCRDFTYVGNAVQAMLKASEAPGVSGKVFNVGTGRNITVLDLVAALNTILGKKLEPRFGPARGGDPRFSLADIKRIKAELGYHPDVTFEEGLKRTLEWYAGRG
jgi:UDP-glucose 4-epimerase